MKLVNDEHEIITLLEAANREWDATDIPFAFYHPCPTSNELYYENQYKHLSQKIYSVKKDIPTDTEFILGNGETLRMN